jgi:hypothetical protein
MPRLQAQTKGAIEMANYYAIELRTDGSEKELAMSQGKKPSDKVLLSAAKAALLNLEGNIAVVLCEDSPIMVFHRPENHCGQEKLHEF